MCSRREQHLDELLSLLQQLRDSWGADGSAETVPKTLSDLLDKAKVVASSPAPPTNFAAAPARQAPPHDGNDGNAGNAGKDGVAVRQLVAVLLDVTRCALTSNGGGGGGGGVGGGVGMGSGTTAPKARFRALSLDCLRLGLLLAPGGGGDGGERGFERDAFAVAAVGARDERWEVRVAAARTGGAALRTGGRRALLGLLSSKQGCWLPAMLVDGYREVEAAARAALSPDPVGLGIDDEVENTNRHPPASSLPSPSSCPDTTPPSAVAAATAEPAASSCSTAVAVAVMRGACEVLRAAATLTASSFLEREDDDSVAEQRFVDLADEEVTRTALRALRGGASLLEGLPPPGGRELHPVPLSSSPTQQQQQQQQQENGEEEEKEATPARVEALELIEAWLAGTLPGPPDDASIPWAEDGEAQGAAAASLAGAAAPGGSLSFEARGAVRALLFGRAEGGVFRATALEAAAAALEEYRSECLLRLTVGNGARGVGEGGEEGLWRRIYCGLLVRLEACFAAAAEEEPVRGVVAEGKVRDVAMSSSSPFAADQPNRSTSGGGDTPVTTPGAGAVELSPFLPLAGVLAEALEEVPFAHEQAVPSSLEHDDDTPVREKKALRAQGSRRRRWMVSSTHLLLRAGTRFCERYRRSIGAPAAAAAGSEGQEGRSAATTAAVKVLVAALPFQQATTRADDPTEAWLSCVRPEDFLPNHATVTTAKTPSAAVATAAVARELTMPIPWESCVHGQAFPRHELPAPWASSPVTVKLGKELVDAAWSALSLDGGTGSGSGGDPAAERSAEALVRALREAARARGGWRDEAGVGIKHAVSAAIRRLRFPLVAGATLGHSLPLALPLMDDYDPAHQAVGFSLLLRLGAEASPTELGWHRGLLLEVLERGIRGGGRDPSASALCLAAAVRLLRRAPRSDRSSSSSSSSSNGAGRAGIRIAREALAQAARATDGAVRVVMVCGAAALLELPATGEGYAPCEFLRPALLCLLPILQSSPVSTRLDARAASLRAVHALCLSCWPRVHAHASKLLCALLWTCGDCARRASVRKSSSSLLDGADGDDKGGAAAAPPPLGVILAANHAAIDAKTDEAVRVHATRLGALVLLLAGENGGGGGGESTPSARTTLRDVCAAVTALRPAGSAMEQLAKRALLLEGERGREDLAAAT